MKTRVMLVDDHQMVRDALVLLVSQEHDLVVVGVAGDAGAAVAVARTTHPDVVVMDLDLPGAGGIAATKSLLEVDPAARVLVLSASYDRALIDAAVDVGACGYLLKGDRAHHLLDGIRLAAGGGNPMAPQVAAVRGTWLQAVGAPTETRRESLLRVVGGFVWPRVAAVLVLVALLLTWPSPVLAHSDLLGSTPRDGDTVSFGTDRLVLVFGDDVVPGSEQVVVRDADGGDVAGAGVVTGATLEVPLDTRVPGRHVVTYRVLSDDGHAVVGELTFVVADAAPGQRVAAATVTPGSTNPPGGSLLPPVWWLTGAAAAIGVGLLLRRLVRHDAS